MSTLTVSYSPQNPLAMSVVELMRKSGAFTFYNETENVPELPCCFTEEDLLMEIETSEKSGNATEEEVKALFAKWIA